jgi:hypothetical protein
MFTQPGLFKIRIIEGHSALSTAMRFLLKERWMACFHIIFVLLFWWIYYSDAQGLQIASQMFHKIHGICTRTRPLRSVANAHDTVREGRILLSIYATCRSDFVKSGEEGFERGLVQFGGALADSIKDLDICMMRVRWKRRIHS